MNIELLTGKPTTTKTFKYCSVVFGPQQRQARQRPFDLLSLLFSPKDTYALNRSPPSNVLVCAYTLAVGEHWKMDLYWSTRCCKCSPLLDLTTLFLQMQSSRLNSPPRRGHSESTWCLFVPKGQLSKIVGQWDDVSQKLFKFPSFMRTSNFMFESILSKCTKGL